MGIPHLAFDFRLRHQGRHGIHHDHIDGPAAYQGVSDFQCLFTGIRLGNQQVVDIHAQLMGIDRIKGMEYS